MFKHLQSFTINTLKKGILIKILLIASLLEPLKWDLEKLSSIPVVLSELFSPPFSLWTLSTDMSLQIPPPSPAEVNIFLFFLSFLRHVSPVHGVLQVANPRHARVLVRGTCSRDGRVIWTQIALSSPLNSFVPAAP